jgi:hypothetical protein
MSLLNPRDHRDKKKSKKKIAPPKDQGSKFIAKPKAPGFVSKQANTGSQRGS